MHQSIRPLVGTASLSAAGPLTETWQLECVYGWAEAKHNI
jgi:hypothetical protein